ncbi:MAG: ferrous iron transport protein B [Polyangiales bacterium]
MGLSPIAGRRALLVGNPNSGKTTLFNRLSGARAKVGNYPGVTVDRRVASVMFDDRTEIELVDLPGTYSLQPRSEDEAIASSEIRNANPGNDVVVCVVDATALSRALYLAVQVRELGLPVVIALNMMDLVKLDQVSLDPERLSEALGIVVVPISANRNEGVDVLKAQLQQTFGAYTISTYEKIQYPLGLAEQARAQQLTSMGIDDAEAVVSARFRFIDACIERARSSPENRRRTFTDRIDGVLTHPVWGLLVFLVVMFAMFEALFSWSEPLIGAVESAIAALQGWILQSFPAGALTELVANGIVAGVGNVLVFAPQILLLFLFIAFLEDTGYLARVAFVIDRVMRAIGLDGRAFVPLLSSFACAVPAIMATRTMENRRDRMIVMLSLPLISCSARLPIFVLIVATIFSGTARIFHVFSPAAVALFALYLLSIAVTLFVAALLRRTLFRGAPAPFVLELPRYRMPNGVSLWLSAWYRLRSFLVDAGTIILAMTIILWALLNYPKNHEVEQQYQAAIAQAEITDASEAARLRDERDSQRLQHSAAGKIGHAIEPVLKPLGFDWRIGVGILGSFAAREVFVSTLGIVFGTGDADENDQSLRTALNKATWPDGSRLITPLSGICLMVFFLLACQCMSTIAVVKRETMSWKWPAFLFSYMTLLAYVVTLLVYQVGRMMSWGIA